MSCQPVCMAHACVIWMLHLDALRPFGKRCVLYAPDATRSARLSSTHAVRAHACITRLCTLEPCTIVAFVIADCVT